MTEDDSLVGDVGQEIDTVWVAIDYAILQHFSKHLYASPNKAVEELVTNGYDALAAHVDVYLPGRFGKERLLVWDDGDSMDGVGLKRLWWIARSPKTDTGDDRIATSSDGKRTRKMVGKFGIGKLASYAVGDRLSHLCRQGDEFLLVSVDYNDAPKLTDQPDDQSERGFATPLLRLSKEEAHEFALGQFAEMPTDFDKLFERETWTLAIVDDVKDDITLYPRRLSWVLGNGMPLRPDFAVSVNGTKVKPTALTTQFKTLDVSDPEVQEGITARWADAAREIGTGVESTVTFGTDTADESTKPVPHWVEVPGLGRVYARISLFEESLRNGRGDDHGRSEGFFVYVRDRLLNPDDSKLLLDDPSFGAFNRMQILMWADGLDADLLADREHLQSDTVLSRALKALQTALYLVARKLLEQRDADAAGAELVADFLQAGSPEFVRQPLVALAQRSARSGEKLLNAAQAKIVQRQLSVDAPLMAIDGEKNELVLNESHPLFESTRKRVGGGKAGRHAMRLVELFALSDALLAGHLLDIGVAESEVDEIVQWREGQLRSLTSQFDTSPELAIAELNDASYVGGERFESAIAKVFGLLGFVAKRDGAPGREDVLIVAPVGRAQDRFTAEGKGKRAGKGAKGKLANDDAEISGASAHARAAEASFAVVVGRGFKGFDKGDSDGAAVLKECRCQEPPVSIVTTECLAKLLEAVQANMYPLTVLIPVLKEIESPDQKLERVESLVRPLDNFDVAGLLDVIWKLQQGQGSGIAVPINQLRSDRLKWKTMTKESFEHVLYGLNAVTGGLLQLVESEYSVELHQSPEIVLEAIAAKPPEGTLDTSSKS